MKKEAAKTESTRAILQNWPTNCEPKAVGEKVTQNLLHRKIYVNANGYMVYPEVCAGFGALRFADTAGDWESWQQLLNRYAMIVTPEGRKMISPERHVDFHVFGVLPLEM